MKRHLTIFITSSCPGRMLMRVGVSLCESACSSHRIPGLPLLRSERRRGSGRGGAPHGWAASNSGAPLSPAPRSCLTGRGRRTRCLLLQSRHKLLQRLILQNPYPLDLMPFGNSNEESQRDSGLQPRVARNELPWESGPKYDNPNGVAARRWRGAATPLGLNIFMPPTQGSSFLATLGWRTQPRWGCRELPDAHLAAQDLSERNYRKAQPLDPIP